MRIGRQKSPITLSKEEDAQLTSIVNSLKKSLINATNNSFCYFSQLIFLPKEEKSYLPRQYKQVFTGIDAESKFRNCTWQ